MFHRSDEEDLVKDVVSLRDQLRQTELSLQCLGDQLSGSNSENSDHSPGRVQPGEWTLDDLRRPNVTEPPPVSPILPGSSLRISPGNVPHSDHRPPSRSEMENSQLRKTLGSVREENSSLVLENQRLVHELEAVQRELAGSHAKVKGTAAGLRSPSRSVREHIQGLEAEVEAHATALRMWEQRLEDSQKSAEQSSRMVAKLKQELNTVQAELAQRISQGKRMELQRNEALRSAERLTAAFREYKGNVSEKMAVVQEKEATLKRSLIKCAREREELEGRCAELERERGEMSHVIRQLREDSITAQTLSAEVAGLRSRADSSAADVSRLQRELADSRAAAEALQRENTELRSLSSSQEQRIALCLQEGEQSRAELCSLEAILNLLHLREDSGGLCVRPCLLPQGPSSGYSDLRNAKPGERYSQLLPALQALDQERGRQASLVCGLQEQLSRAREELSTLQSSMEQRTNHFQHIHRELQERAGEAESLERELRKKTARVEALEKQVQEKAAAYSAAAVKNCELEQILLDKSSSLQHAESLYSRKHKEIQQALDKARKASAEKCVQLQDKAAQLEQCVEKKTAQIMDLEKKVCVAQRERKGAVRRAEQLQASLTELTQDKELSAIESQETARRLNLRAEESESAVRDLETALLSCRDELSSYVDKMEDSRTLFEKQLELKSSEVQSLQAELNNSTQAAKASGKYLSQLQFSLQQQGAMLQESSARVAELEESQAQLQRTVAQLEKELAVEREAAAQQQREGERGLQEAQEEAQAKGREVAKLTCSLTQLTAEMDECRGELTEMEAELLKLRRDSSSKASQLSQMKQSLEETRGLLERKADLVLDLEEQLHRSEMDRRNSLQRAELLESQLKAVRGELAGTLDHLQELRGVLQNTQLTVEERDATIDKLAEELRESRRELEDRTHEMLDMDTTLRDRQEELQKRAQQLSQLDVAIQEHKMEQERKVLGLQRALERAEQQALEHRKQVDFLSERLEMARSELSAKENLQKDALEQGQQLRLCREQLQRTAQEQRELRSRCENLARELDSGTQLAQEKEARAKQLMQELAAVQSKEAALTVAVTSLKDELLRVKEEHRAEVSSLQQTRAQLLRVSDQSRIAQEQLAATLQGVRARLQEALERADALQEALQTREQELQNARETLLLKESEVTRLQAKISSYDRRAELQGVSLLRESLKSPPKSPSPPHHPQETLFSAGFPEWPEEESVDLPRSVTSCLQGAPRPLEHSWQGLSGPDASSSEASFNPLTYAACEDTLPPSPGPLAQDHTFTGMLQMISRMAAGQDHSAPSWRYDSSAPSSSEAQKDPSQSRGSSPEGV